MEEETQNGNFTFHEVEENEGNLEKLKRWLNKIPKRDFFSIPLSKQAEESLVLCETLFVEFTERVYQTEGNYEGDIQIN
ncbi:Chromate resistance protein ChrB [Peribacillus butanolivorans]|uniref:Chromate resistance protein ChrB n=1 Tax=Peribacillus butanolivorans TaxID=421767 RepID=UPI0035DAB027